MTEPTTAIALLPSSSDKNTWNPQQKALMESLGLKGEKNVKRGENWEKQSFEAPPSIVEAFIHQIHRTQLDPVARQIYCIERGGKWGIQISIDGFRLIAERSGEYRGQTPAQWCDGKLYKVPLRDAAGNLERDGQGNAIMVEDYRWLDAWTAKEPPAAARVGVYRDGFTEPMWGVATFEGYVARDRNGKPTGQWESNSANQTAKCAEMLALRKAYPQELSGLYGTEEMEQAANPRGAAPAPARASAPVPIVEPIATRDWAEELATVTTLEAAGALYREAEALGELGVVVGLVGDKDDGSANTVMDLFWARRKDIEKAAAATPAMVDVPKADPGKRQWPREARAKKTRLEVTALVQEATAAGAPVQIIEELEAIARSLPDEVEAEIVSDWAVAEIPKDTEWAEGDPVVDEEPF